MLAIYDEYAQLRKLPKGQRPSLETFLKEKNEEYGTSYTRTNMLMKFKCIEEHTERAPLPELVHTNRKIGNYYLPEYALTVLDEYEEIIRLYRQEGKKPPSLPDICEKLAKRYEISPRTIQEYIIHARFYRRSLSKAPDSGPNE